MPSPAAPNLPSPPGPFAVSFDMPPPSDAERKPKRKPTKPAAYVVYVDGSSLVNPGPSGFAALIIAPDGSRRTLRGGAQHATNNQMELQAAITALRELPTDAVAEIRSDSQYVVNGASVWRKKWEASGWRNAEKKPVLNADLWKELYALADSRPGVSFAWVKGHAADEGNLYVDDVAREEAEKQRRRKA